MPDNTTINSPVVPGGQNIASEDVGGGVNMPRGKIVTGAHGTDGGDVTVTNPLPVELSDGANVLGTSTHPVRTDPTGTTAQPVTATSLPLPTGAAQDATLTSGSVLVQVQDGAGHTIGTTAHPVKTDPTGTTTQPVSALSLPLPTGAAQDTTITARLNTLGQKASSGSAPVVIASDQSAVPVSGTVTVQSDTVNGVIPIAIKPTNSSLYAPSYQSFLGQGTNTIKGSPGNLFALRAVNRNAQLRYLQLFNQASGGPSGSPVDSILIPPGGGEVILGDDFFTASGVHFGTGLTFGFSTTSGSYTAATATDHDASFIFV